MARFVVGLSGGVASGKSAADAAFAGLGVPVLDADRIARELVAPGQPALAEIVRLFGGEVLDGEGRLDRRRLRERIFADEAARRALEAILHPRIRGLLAERAAAADAVYVIASIPLLAEGGGREAYPWLARILVIDVSEATQHERLCRRDGIDEALAARMIAAQAGRAARLAMADDILNNEGTLAALAGHVAALDRLYRALAA
ncbi:dephospho-CoA kinase [Lysobacter pythonis]|uniref:Dephospho-CoA kinase n=1 Tax=Solilutibacter pythonis TaxID=2483112 RepID=A0A3M2I1B6_9GAMM|nr:dephospho-CoA kinase [Lysobacter pythonis]RMH94175.1 dephospho-CoA kinase [Lysobacter pythonis]